MPLPNLPVPRYPNVPVAPGVPPVQRAVGFVNDAIILVSDARTLANLFAGPKWGIFTADGRPWIIGDSVKDVSIKKEYRIPDYPIAPGSFATYNKVEAPFAATLSFTKGGSDADRAAFLTVVQAAVASLTLYSVVMPEFTFPSANLTGYQFARQSNNGVTLLTVEIGIEEVRTSATTTFSNTQQPAGASPQSGAAVQAVAPDPGQVSAATGGAN